MRCFSCLRAERLLPDSWRALPLVSVEFQEFYGDSGYCGAPERLLDHGCGLLTPNATQGNMDLGLSSEADDELAAGNHELDGRHGAM